MSVTVAKTAGFCFGVRRAVDLAEQMAKQHGTIYAYGEIIHNMHEIARLEKLGVVVRSCGNYPGLDDSWYRTAVRTRRENDALLAALREAMA